MLLSIEKHSNHFSVLFIFTISIIVFSNTLTNDFVWDSSVVILEDPRIRSVEGALSFFTKAYTHIPGVSQNRAEGFQPTNYYRPFIGILHAIEYKLFNTNPFGYKLVNLLANAFFTTIIFLIVEKITKEKLLSVLATLLFAVNPTKAEVVYWVYSDSHIFVALFVAIAFYSYLYEKRYLSCIFFLLALLSQENAVVFPVLIIFYEFFQRGSTWKAAILKSLPYWGLTTIYLGIRYSVVGGIPVRELHFPETPNTFATLIQRYIKIYFLPDSPVTAYHFQPEYFISLNSEIVLSYFVLAVLAALLVFLWKESRKDLFWAAWFLLWISVVLNLGGQSDYLMAEKPLYIAGLGLAVLLAKLAASLPGKKIGIPILIALTVFHATLAYSRSYHWRNTESYLTEAINHDPDFALLHYALGLTYSKDNRHSESIVMFETLLEQQPDEIYYRLGMAETYFSLGNYRAFNFQDDAAVEAYSRSIFFHANNPRAYNNIGNLLFRNKQYKQAIVQYAKAIELQPDLYTSLYNIGLAYKELGDFQKASVYFNRYNRKITQH